MTPALIYLHGRYHEPAGSPWPRKPRSRSHFSVSMLSVNTTRRSLGSCPSQSRGLPPRIAVKQRLVLGVVVRTDGRESLAQELQ